MAESMAAGAQYSSTPGENSNTILIERTDSLVETFSYTGEQCPCTMPDQPCPVWPDCGISGGGGSTNDPRIPRGTIEVQDVRVCSNQINNVPVRQARIVCKRWFKIDRTYTDDQGRFVSSKKFKNKVKINLKTKNQFANVRKIRGIRLWQILFPVKKRIGVFDQGDLANVTYLFTKPNPTSAHDRELPYWVAVTTHNSVLEFRQYATEFGIGQPPSNLRILITNWGFQQGAGAAPMWNKCSSFGNTTTYLVAYAGFFLANPASIVAASGLTALVNTLKDEVDIIIGYAATAGDYNCRLNSNNVKAIAFHEIGHSSHFAQAGCGYWQDYRARVTDELLFGDANTKPYGDGTENNAGVIAVGEMWGNHCEFVFTNRHYGNGGAFGGFGVGFTARMQFADWPNITGGLNANLNAIENHDPNLNADVHRWIPQGICNDLIDPVGEGFPVNDNVAGYTTQQCFNALQSDVKTVPVFRDRLLQQNGNNQFADVNDLFFRYGY